MGSVFYFGNCEYLELIYFRDGREVNKNRFREGFDNFRGGEL